MNKIFKLFMLAAVVLGFSSCYNEFEEPAPAKVWTKADFADSKLKIGRASCRERV